MLDGVRGPGIEEVLEHRPAGERPPREGGDELARVRRRHYRDAGAEARQLSEQVDGLVRGDAAGDAEDQFRAGQTHELFSILSAVATFSQLLGVSSSFTR